MDKKKKIYVFIAILLCAGIATWPLILVFRKINAPKDDCKDSPDEGEEGYEEPHFRPMPLSDSQAKLFDDYYKNLTESVEIEAFIDGKSWPALISTSRLLLFHRLQSPVTEFVRIATYKYWIYAEYTSEFEFIEINEDIRKSIQPDLDKAKLTKDHIFLCRECNQEVYDENLPTDSVTDCLKNSAIGTPEGKEVEYICADNVFDGGKVVIHIEKKVKCDLLKWKRTAKRTSFSPLILTAYLADEYSEEIGIPWCENNPNRLLGVYYYLNKLHLGRKFGMNDKELYDECYGLCRVSYLQCKADCETASCDSGCVLEFGECTALCPCGEYCQSGCTECANEICLGECRRAESENQEYMSCRENALENQAQCVRNCPPDSYCFGECNILFSNEINECPCVEFQRKIDGHTLTGVKNGVLMMVGGFDNEERQYSREIWRLKNEIWRMVGSLNEFCYFGSALNIDGFIFIISGYKSASNGVYPVERITTTSDEIIDVQVIGEHDFFAKTPVIFQALPDFCV
ncbi:Oidioi.mRNA.OKI2018_I69.chr2.g4443.t1.cds [Oikopleura dioica]|uniref:Oidioi.mRNA.OKI2018_I69.chr2.g4443.t1.cds n=1 Tax=Oikopleura dioica TaxID=34765 RepID=A0ABN7SX32_OIKDI|nr:Oidioi.mRNA.OKI2018_I69.chr2.g4443.t1.cds [Oikopleura dioica]